uniref:Uncharacterized protein n=1 Tax=Macrostomum lignano TaxID=282301 RepID=A0A1I8GD33_9PLAT
MVKVVCNGFIVYLLLLCVYNHQNNAKQVLVLECVFVFHLING